MPQEQVPINIRIDGIDASVGVDILSATFPDNSTINLPVLLDFLHNQFPDLVKPIPAAISLLHSLQQHDMVVSIQHEDHLDLFVSQIATMARLNQVSC
jgi:hypothetical protein